MSTAVNKSTFEVLRSVNTPDFPPVVWVINSPNLDTLVGSGTDSNPQTPKRYWIVDVPSSQNLREMTQAEKDAIDVSVGSLSLARTERKGTVKAQTDAFVLSLYSTSDQQDLINLRSSASGEQKVFLDSFFAWYRGIYSALKVTFSQIDAAATVPAIQSISLSYTSFAASNPLVTTDGVLALASGAVVGTGTSVYAAAVSTTTSAIFQTKVEILNSTLAAGTYRFIASYGWNVDSTASDIEVQVQEKVGAGAYANIVELHKQETSESAGTFGVTGTDQRFNTTRIFERTLSAAVYSWRIQYRSETSTIAVSMWETLLRIEALG
jgi:hypothetical protein